MTHAEAPPTVEEQERYALLLPLVGRLARGLWRVYRVGEYHDLFQDGCVGMVRAVKQFDASRGVPLEAYARPIIAGAILNGIRARDPLSEHARKLLRDAERDRDRMLAEGREVPTMREMATRISGLGAALLMAYRAQTVSIDAPLPEGERVPLDHTSDPARIAEARERAHRLREALATLTERQRAVLEMTYFGDKTATAVGEHLQISAQRVSQLHKSALANMRRALVAAP